MVNRAPRVRLDLPGKEDCQVNQVSLDQMVHLENLVPEEDLVTLAHRDHLA